MPYSFFHERFPKIAEAETRSATITGHSITGLPRGEYAFLEMFCDDPGCDCRRVFFYVIARDVSEVQAVIAWGWEDSAFYRNWLHDDDEEMIRALKGPELNLGSPQKALAPALLELAKTVLLKDPHYIDRIKRHYQMFRADVDTQREPRARKPKTRQKRRRKSSR